MTCTCGHDKLPGTLGHLPGCPSHPAFGGVSLLNLLDEAQATERKLRQQIRLLHDATIILRNALSGHRTVEQHHAYGEAARKMDEAAALDSPQEFVDGVLEVFRK